ncbi:MAG: hypothetical protein WCT04_17675 [Planctomycetota bacterium]
MKQKSNPEHGSVLIFAVVVLAILAMLSTAFLIVVRHAIQAAKSGVQNTQPVAAAEAAEIRATAVIKAASQRAIISTPEGVIAGGTGGDPMGPTGMNLILPKDQITVATSVGTVTGLVGEQGLSSSDYTSLAHFFRHDPEFDLLPASNPAGPGIVHPSFACLSSQFPHTSNGNPSTGIVRSTPYYTSAPLRILAKGQLTNAPYDADRATPYYIRAGFAEFNNPVFAAGTAKGSTSSNLHVARTQTGSIGTIRGRHFVWVRDLDALFYAIPSMWGLRAPGNASVNYTNLEQTIATGILNYLMTTPGSGMSTNNIWTAPNMANIAALTPKDYAHIGDVATVLQAMTPSTSANYPYWRSDIESYFSTTLDARRDVNGNIVANSLGQPYATFKPAPAAMNINTVPEEILQAMLSQIPYSDTPTIVPFGTYFPTIAPANNFAELLAKRIIAKRPFLSRMDFEDFVATLLPGTTTDMNTELGAITYALSKRIDKEISVAQFMEIPGLPEGDYGDGTANPYKGSNTLVNMTARFNYFLTDSDLSGGVITLGTRDQCKLTVKAFNNLLNSVSSSPGPSVNVYNYSQVKAAGTTGASKQLEISGDDTLKYVPLGGDDEFIYDASNKVTGINTGVNGIAETQIAGFSYYSHDASNPQNAYKPIRFNSQDPTYDVAFCTNPKNAGKFVYGISDVDPLMPIAPLNTQFKNYFLADLKLWSCIGDGTLSGYYDMYFNFYDQMLMELGERVPNPGGGAPPPGAKDTISVQFPTGTAPVGKLFQTGVNDATSTDVQIIILGDDVTAPDIVLVIPGPSGTLTTSAGSVPFSIATPNTPGDDRAVEAIRLGKTASTSTVSPNDMSYTNPTDGYTYIIAKKANAYVLKSTYIAGDPLLGDVDRQTFVIVDGGNGKCETSTVSDDKRTLDRITVGPNLYNESFVWGPIRASQRSIDQQFSPDQRPSAATLFNTGTTNGDVAWSPPICFRSRFFETYVLAQGFVTQPIVGTVSAVTVTPGSLTNTVTFVPLDSSKTGAIVPGEFFAVNSAPAPGKPPVQHVYTIESYSGGTLTLSSPLVATINTGDLGAVYTSKIIGERRTESIYDSVADKILWTRSPLTDKRTLGDYAP